MSYLFLPFVPLFLGSFLCGCMADEPIQQQYPNSGNICSCNCNIPKQNTEEKLCKINETLLESVVQRENRKLEKELKSWISNILGRGDESFDFLFTNKGTSDYAMMHDLSHDLTAFTISLWMKSSDRTTSNDAALISYATSSGNDNTLLLITSQKLRIYVLGEEKFTSMKLNDGKWHHVAFTWQSSDGAWKGYKDGIQVINGSGLKKGNIIPKTGTLVLGQDQDSVGGKFVDTQSYIGILTQVNLWDKVLTPQEIKSLSSGCHKSDGNILKWADWLSGVRGDVRILRPSSCNA